MARASRDEDRLASVTERLLGAFEELDFLHSLAEVLANPSEIEDLDAYLLGETRRIFEADCGWILRAAPVRGPGTGLRLTVSEGLPESSASALSDRVVGPRAEAGRLPYLVDDLHREPGSRPLPEGTPRGFLAVPLTLQRELLGVICLGKQPAGRTFSSGDQRLLTTLATQASLFLKNADLLQRLKLEASALGRRLERLEAGSGAQPDISWLKGRSPVMRQLARQVEGVAAAEATVLLLGESGTGKSMVARILHRLSPRRNGPFVEINCGAVPSTLIESELFGHARGAFTGADRDRAGLFEAAGGGTIFLDEIAELPLESQVKLLTVLEQRRVRRVGENRDRPVNARVMAATNAELAASVRDGKFREDLFYRLNVLSLVVPPLRERPEEILPLARKFLEDLSRETHRHSEGLTHDAEDVLLRYAWPGNVRELRNVIERSLLLVPEGGRIEAADLPFASNPVQVAAPASPPVSFGEGLGERSLPQAVGDYERALLVTALAEGNGVVAKAADILGISRTNLHNKLRKHGLERRSSWR